MKKRFTVITAFLLAFALLLAGCSSNKKGDATAPDRDYGGSESFYEDAGLTSYNTSVRKNSSQAAPADAYAEYAAAEKTSSETETPKSPGAEAGRKLVKTMAFSIETQDFDKSTAEISFMVSSLGGYIEDSSVSGNSYRKNDTRTATYVLRIPVTSLDEFSGSIDKVGNVTSRSEKVKDITLTYADTASRLKSLETQRDALIEMMGKAETLEDLLTIQDHLYSIQYELEYYASQIRLYDNQVEYSSVSIKLQEVKIYTEPVEEPETFGERLVAAFKEGLEGAGEFFKDLVIFLAGSLPVLLVFAAVIVLIVVLIRKAIKKRRARRAAAMKAHAAVPNVPDSGNVRKD